MKDYSVTIIPNEAVPLASMPNSIIDSGQWILIMVSVLVIVSFLYYLYVCRSKEKQVLTLIARMENEHASYNRFNYFQMKEVEQELHYLMLEQESLEKNEKI